MRAKEFIDEMYKQPIQQSFIDMKALALKSLINEPIITNLLSYSLHVKDEYSLGSIEYGLFDKNIPTAYLEILSPSMLGFKYDSIGFEYSEPNFRGRKLVPMIITYYVQNIRNPLLSDNSSSDDSEGMWRSFIKSPGNLKISLYDISTDQKSPVPFINGEVDKDIWKRGETDVRFLVEK